MCPAGTTQLVVDAFGDLYPCWMFAGMHKFRMGNIMREDIFSNKSKEVLERIANNSKKANLQCATCYARYVCSSCIGTNNNITGQIEPISENFCNTVRASLRAVVLTLGQAKRDPVRWKALMKAARTAKENRAFENRC